MRFKYFALFGLLAAFAVSACTQERVTYSEPLHHAPARTRDAAVSQAALSLYAEYETANYEQYADNPVKSTIASPLSTFSLNVATASYPNVRRFLESAQLPPENAVRTEELLNYFPAGRNHDMMRLGDSPFEVDYQLTPCPWNKKNVLFYLHLRALDPAPEAMPPANLVFLVDVSGSMNSNERLPMAKEALKALVNELRPEDKISIVTYSGNVRLALRSTSGEMKRKIRETIDELNASGSTAGGEGLLMAYEQAEKNFIRGGINRIIMCTDGDFNVGVSSTAELEKLVSEKRDKGVTLSILGFGTNNLNDEMMMHIADCGNGNYSYIDKMSEAQKVMGEELRATFVTVAKDAKAQIEFNPAQVLEYRQIGYELRQLAAEQFNDDKVDAGDIGAGKDVIVMYELTLAGGEPKLDPLRYQNGVATASGEFSNELAFIKLRWKSPEALEKPDMPSQSVSLPISRDEIAPSFENLGGDMVFYAAVAAYGQKLRNNPALAETSWKDIEAWADVSSQYDENGYRKEFLRLVRIAASLSAK